MLDTNVVSAFMHSRSPALDRRIARHDRPALLLSAVGYGETQYGLTRRPDATRLHTMARALFERVTILDFTRTSAECYGRLRTDMQRAGRALQPLDMLIAAHALEAGATLVSSDRAFQDVPGLAVEDWTAA